MQIARLAPFEVNEKNAIAANIAVDLWLLFAFEACGRESERGTGQIESIPSEKPETVLSY